MQDSQMSLHTAPKNPDKESQQQQENESLDSSLDGGPRAWATLVGGFCAIAAQFGYANAFGVYQDVYTREKLASASRISWIGSSQLFFILTIGIISGKMLDLGHFRVTLLAGSLLYVFSIFMVSLAHHDQYYQIYLSQGLGMGLGAGLIHVPSLAIQSQHWKKRRGLAMGVVTIGPAIGGIVFPIMLNQLFKSTVGFEWGVRASGFVVLGLLVLANLLMRENPSIRAVEKPRPDIKSIFTDVPFMIMSFACIPMTLGIFFPYFYMQLYSILHGVNPNTAFYMLAIINASSILGRTLPGYLADRIGPFNVFIPASFASAVLIFAIPGLQSQASIIVFSILYGITSGAFLALSGPLIATVCRDPSEYGIRFGVGFAGTGIGVLVGNPISGALLGSEFLWWRAVVFNGVVMLVGVFFMLVSRQMYVKRKNTQYL